MPAAMAAARPAASPPLTDTSGGQQAAPGSSTPTSPAPDPFDAPSFDVPRYVNSMFPTGAGGCRVVAELDGNGMMAGCRRHCSRPLPAHSPTITSATTSACPQRHPWASWTP